jgi:FMN phosphatase YigB (HAD superfamily)
MQNIKAVVFDIDGTLTPQNSWTAFTRDIGVLIEGEKIADELRAVAWKTVHSLAEVKNLLGQPGMAGGSHG